MEETMMMMVISSPANPRRQPIAEEPITSSTCPSWKLYDNPFYNSDHNQHRQLRHCQISNHLRRLNLPLSARQLAASFWDLSFFKSVMESELQFARIQIMDLKTELEYERKARKKAELMNKRLARELVEERRGREAMERFCEDLAREMSSDKAEIDKMKKEIEEERKMLRMAEVLREERVQMKLAEAKILFEEKLSELEGSKRTRNECLPPPVKHQNDDDDDTKGIPASSDSVAGFSVQLKRSISAGRSDYRDVDAIACGTEPTRLIACNMLTVADENDCACGKSTTLVLGEKTGSGAENTNVTLLPALVTQRRASPEPENPHIRRGIKGFVEFPRAVRATGSKTRPWGTKLECQKAQLRVLLKQKSPVRSNNFIVS